MVPLLGKPALLMVFVLLQGLGISEEAAKAHIRPGTNNFLAQVRQHSTRLDTTFV